MRLKLFHHEDPYTLRGSENVNSITSGKPSNPLQKGQMESSAQIKTTSKTTQKIKHDGKILKWSSLDGECIGPFVSPLSQNTDASGTPSGDQNGGNWFITELHWLNTTVPGKSQASSEVAAIGTTDGRFYICTRSGKIEKLVADAHKGAVLGLKWNYEGSALLTAGEDGQVKIWSRAGMLRSTLAQMGYPIYSAAWSPENDKVLLTNGRNLVIKHIQPGAGIQASKQAPSQWKAHDASVLKVDWNLSNNLIVSGGEDRKYKVWDVYGRLLYSSSVLDHPITSIAWNPSGDMFAVGSFNLLKICDKLGWTQTLSEPDSGSIMNIAWTPDGTQIGCAGGNGSVIIGNVVDRRFEWKNFEVTIVGDHKIRVHDVMQGSVEALDFRDRVIRASIGFHYLIVCTPAQCYIYSDKNWNTPSIVDLVGGRVVCIKQCADCFVIVDTVSGIQVFGYDARLMSCPKYPGLRPEYVTQQSISVSGDVLAIKDRIDEKSIYLFDTVTGKPLATIDGGLFRHYIEVMEIGLSQSSSKSSSSGHVKSTGNTLGRQLVIVDKNRDIWLTGLIKIQPKKLGSMVDTFAWNDEMDMIAAVADGKFVVWYYPNAVFIDEDIAPLTKYQKDASMLGRDAFIVNFTGTQATLRKADGALITLGNLPPYPAVLHEQAKKKMWEAAIRLCRYAKMDELWACLAVMSIAGQDLNTAEVAYAMIQEPAKVQHICRIRQIASPEIRSAELALLRRQPREAEGILLSSGHVYRAIMMWVYAFNWDRALELAMKHKCHIETVVYYRDRYLQTIGRKEMNKKFIQISQGMEIDPEKIREAMKAEESKEKRA